ncbi:hypothetical protein SDJN02_26677, partial [Cucurbita argyrosperma subsp. argyrosperma]
MYNFIQSNKNSVRNSLTYFTILNAVHSSKVTVADDLFDLCPDDFASKHFHFPVLPYGNCFELYHFGSETQQQGSLIEDPAQSSGGTLRLHHLRHRSDHCNRRLNQTFRFHCLYVNPVQQRTTERKRERERRKGRRHRTWQLSKKITRTGSWVWICSVPTWNDLRNRKPKFFSTILPILSPSTTAVHPFNTSETKEKAFEKSDGSRTAETELKAKLGSDRERERKQSHSE